MLSQLTRVPKWVVQVPQPCIVRSVGQIRTKLFTFVTANKKKGGPSYCHVKYHNKFHCKKYVEAQEALKEKERNSSTLLYI